MCPSSAPRVTVSAGGSGPVLQLRERGAAGPSPRPTCAGAAPPSWLPLPSGIGYLRCGPCRSSLMVPLHAPTRESISFRRGCAGSWLGRLGRSWPPGPRALLVPRTDPHRREAQHFRTDGGRSGLRVPTLDPREAGTRVGHGRCAPTQDLGQRGCRRSTTSCQERRRRGGG